MCSCLQVVNKSNADEQKDYLLFSIATSASVARRSLRHGAGATGSASVRFPKEALRRRVRFRHCFLARVQHNRESKGVCPTLSRKRRLDITKQFARVDEHLSGMDLLCGEDTRRAHLATSELGKVATASHGLAPQGPRLPPTWLSQSQANIS